MKYIILILFVFCAIEAGAQSINSLKSALSVGAELGIPQNSVYSIGLSASAKGELPVADKFCLTLTTGYDFFFYKSNLFGTGSSPSAAQYIPIKAGAKYYFTGEAYLEGEMGTVIETNYLKQDLFAFSVGPGFVVPSGDNHSLDFGFRYEQWSDHQVRQTAIRMAYRF